MMAWWNDREPRERLLLAIAGGLLAFAIVLQFVLMPAVRSKTAQKARSVTAAQTLDLVVADAAARDERVAGGDMVASLDDLRAGIVDLANRRGLSVSRVQGGEAGSVTIAMDSASPELIMAWIADIEATYRARPSRVSLSNDGAGGVRSSVSFDPAAQ